MERREVPVSVFSVGFLSGCMKDGTGSTTPTNTSTESTTPTNTSTTTTSTDTCYPEFCEGSIIAEVDVDASFSGTAVLEAACRQRSYELQSGDSVTIIRQVDGETCDITISVDGQTVFDRNIQDYVSLSLRVGPDGNVSESIVEL
ncbi:MULTISPECIES: hypothetical protein [unclassified Haloarcula]|uniref:hypothetical protein n=1 Tax=unclassified Haloarcula TaxID=2624677 RepID=UPI001249064D|nr:MULTISPECIES: hypothetical protein [unclassified Haloarcula]